MRFILFTLLALSTKAQVLRPTGPSNSLIRVVVQSANIAITASSMSGNTELGARHRSG